jgi:hypothetical protein
LQNVLWVAAANVVTLSWDVQADAGLLCNRAAMLWNMMKETLFVLPCVHHSLGISTDSLASSSEKAFQPLKVDL